MLTVPVVKLSLRGGGGQVLDVAGTGAATHHLARLGQELPLTEVPPARSLVLVARVVGGAGRGQTPAGLTVQGACSGCGRLVLGLQGLSARTAHCRHHAAPQLSELHPGLCGQHVLGSGRPLGRLALYERRAVVTLLQQATLPGVGRGDGLGHAVARARVDAAEIETRMRQRSGDRRASHLLLRPL